MFSSSAALRGVQRAVDDGSVLGQDLAPVGEKLWIVMLAWPGGTSAPPGGRRAYRSGSDSKAGVQVLIVALKRATSTTWRPEIKALL